MNTLLLTYALEVERCSSITRAAENLFMAQPNLSKAIKELEESMGFAIFSRTSRGVVPTERGREFLSRARAITEQLHALEALSGRRDSSLQRFRAALPPAEYAASCFAQLADTLDTSRPMDLRVDECGADKAINGVADGQFDLGLISIPCDCQDEVFALLRKKHLKAQTLWSYDALLLFSLRHPLAHHRELSLQALASAPLIVCDDPDAAHTESCTGRICLSSRIACLNLLSRMQTAYMWSSPEPDEVLRRYSLTQRPCAAAPRLRDVMIYPANYHLSPLDLHFIELLQSAVSVRSEVSPAATD